MTAGGANGARNAAMSLLHAHSDRNAWRRCLPLAWIICKCAGAALQRGCRGAAGGGIVRGRTDDERRESAKVERQVGETGESQDFGALSSLRSPQATGMAGKTDPNQFVVYLAFLFPCFAR